MAFNFSEGQDNYLLSAVSWITKAYLNKTLRKVTVEKLMVYNETQCTGYIDLVLMDGKQEGTLEYHNDIWYCNELRNILLSSSETIDFLDKDGQPITKYYHNGEVTTLIADNEYVVDGIVDPLVDNVTYRGRLMNYNGARFIANSSDLTYNILGVAKIKNIKKWFEMSEISGKFTAVRLYTSNISGLDMKLLQVTPLIKSII